MIPFARNTLLIRAGSIIGVLLVALLAVPYLVDLDAYKPEIAARVKSMTGRDLVIGGPIRFSLLPLPAVTLDEVKFSNARDAKTPYMAEVKKVRVQPSLLALLVARIEISKVTLDEPKIALEVGPEGRPNWDFAPAGAPTPAHSAPSMPLSLPRLDITDGTLVFSDAAASLTITADKADLTASVGSLDGPYASSGKAVVNGAPLTFNVVVGARGPKGFDADMSLEAGGGRLSCKGTLSELGPDARLSGRASASADNLVAFVEALSEMAGLPRPEVPPLLAGRFRFDGPVELSPSAFAANDFRLVLGEDKGSGSLAVTLKPALAVEAKFTAPRLDLDRWLAALPLPPELTAESAPPPTPSPAAAPAPASPVAASPAAEKRSWLASITAKLALEVGEVIYNKKPVRNLAVELEARGDAVAVPRLTATLPGDFAIEARSTMSGDPARPTVSGGFSLVGPRLRETLSWLGIDVSSVPAGKLRQLSMKGAMSSKDGNVQVDNATVALDDLKGAGAIVVVFTVPLSVTTHVELDTLDLDSYLPPDSAKPAASTSPAASVTPILALLGPSIGLTLKVARIVFRGDTIAGVDIDVARKAGTLLLNGINVADLASARLAMRGAVANYWTPKPLGDFAFQVETPDMDRLLRLAGAAPAGLGAVSVRGGVAGNAEDLTVRGFALNAMGWSLLASGALALPGAAQGKITSVSYKGSLVVNGQPMEASIGVDVVGDRPVLTVDVKTDTLDFNKLGGTAAAVRAPAGVQPALESRPIGTPLRAFDGRFKVTVATLGGAPVQLGNAEIDATLKDGVLTVSRFKGDSTAARSTCRASSTAAGLRCPST